MNVSVSMTTAVYQVQRYATLPDADTQVPQWPTLSAQGAGSSQAQDVNGDSLLILQKRLASSLTLAPTQPGTASADYPDNASANTIANKDSGRPGNNSLRWTCSAKSFRHKWKPPDLKFMMG